MGLTGRCRTQHAARRSCDAGGIFEGSCRMLHRLCLMSRPHEHDICTCTCRLTISPIAYAAALTPLALSPWTNNCLGGGNVDCAHDIGLVACTNTLVLSPK